MKTKIILKSLAVIALILLISVFISSNGKAVDKASCSITFCINSTTVPVVGHTITIYDSNGNAIGSCVTGDNGCCSPDIKFENGKSYCVCDMSVPCLHNCTRFTVDCSNPTVSFNSCGGDCN
jgi:hypothetical protein